MQSHTSGDILEGKDKEINYLLHNRATSTFNIIFLTQLAATINYICTYFDIDSSSRFLFKLWTLTDIDTESPGCQRSLYPTHWLLPALDDKPL